MSQLYPVHTPTSHFPKIHLNIILPSTPGSPKWSLSFRFPHQNPVYASPLLHTCYIPRQSHSSRFDLLALMCVYRRWTSAMPMVTGSEAWDKTLVCHICDSGNEVHTSLHNQWQCYWLWISFVFFWDGNKRMQTQMEFLYFQIILERNLKIEVDGIRICLHLYKYIFIIFPVKYRAFLHSLYKTKV